MAMSMMSTAMTLSMTMVIPWMITVTGLTVSARSQQKETTGLVLLVRCGRKNCRHQVDLCKRWRKSSDAIQSINYAADMGFEITSNSYWVTYSYSQALRDAIERGGLFVAAAGNDYRNDLDTSEIYPASYDLDNILVVAASDDRDQLTDFTNIGAQSVDLAAAGKDIYSTIPANQYAFFSGTSMATPLVAGLLVFLRHITLLSTAEIKETHDYRGPCC